MIIDYTDIDIIVEERRLDPIYFGLAFFNEQIHYPLIPLKAFCLDFQSGFGAGKDDQALEENGMIQIRPTNIDSEGMLKYDKNVFVPKSLNKTLLEVDDVLFNNTNSQELVGKTAILKDEKQLFFSNHITRIKVDKTKTIPDYLWIILNLYQRMNIFYSICTNWNNQSGVGIELLRSLKVPLPPKEIQQQIVDLYNNAVKEKQAKEQEAQNLLASIDEYLLKELGIELSEKNAGHERYFEVSIVDLTGGRLDPYYYRLEFRNLFETIKNKSITKLRDYITSINYGASVSNSYVEKGIPFLRIKDLLPNEIQKNAIVFLPEEMTGQLQSSLVHTNDFLISRSGTIGMTAIVYNEFDSFAFGSFMIRFSTENINREFLSYYINSTIGQYYFKRNKIGAIQGNITIPTIKDLPVPDISLEKQNEIVEHIQSVRAKAKQLQCEAIAGLEQAKKEVEQLITHVTQT